MKKLLIALLALGGLAIADDSQFISSDLLSTYKQGDSFTLTFTVNSTKIPLASTSYLMTLADSYYWISQRNVQYGFGETTTDDPGQVVPKGEGTETGNVVMSTEGQALGWYSWKQDLSSTTCGPLTRSTITLSYDAESNNTVWTVQKPQVGAYGAVMQTLTMKNYSGIDASKITYNTATLTPSVSSFSFTPTTPEPATATLSLLALAGMAARRRRH